MDAAKIEQTRIRKTLNRFRLSMKQIPFPQYFRARADTPALSAGLGSFQWGNVAKETTPGLRTFAS
jgi:hypothetical protein